MKKLGFCIFFFFWFYPNRQAVDRPRGNLFKFYGRLEYSHQENSGLNSLNIYIILYVVIFLFFILLFIYLSIYFFFL